ncbi:MAG: ABC transporter ATP-binding protein [Candidatus Moranbacteria bacterium]|nr:ABC transporter ATP-binding protein [Candidatus Moranbacteria bacterium]
MPIPKNRKSFEFIFKLNDLFSRREKIQFLTVVAVSLLMAFFQAMGVASILPFINIVMDPDTITQNHWLNYFFGVLGFEKIDSFIIFSGFIVLSLLVIGNTVSALATWMKINFVWQKNHKLACVLLKKYLFMPYDYFLSHNTADLGKNVLMEVNHLTGGYINPLINIINNSVTIVVIFSLLIYVNPAMTLFAAAILALLYFIIYYYLSDKLKNEGERRLEKNKKRFETASEALGGIKDVKVRRVEGFFLDRFFQHSEIYSGVQAWNQTVGQIPRYLMEVVAFGGIVGILIFLIYSGIPTQKIIPIISFFAFAGYRLMPALQEIFNSLTTLKFNRASLDRIYEDMAMGKLAEQKIKFSRKRKEVEPLAFEHEITLENIGFFYSNSNRKILDNVNLKIKKNAFVALIGTTGSGKTTLVDLILGLLHPRSGQRRGT